MISHYKHVILSYHVIGNKHLIPNISILEATNIQVYNKNYIKNSIKFKTWIILKIIIVYTNNLIWKKEIVIMNCVSYE